MTNVEKIKRISNHYGFEAQSRQCIEEMAELMQALNKFWRKDLKLGQLTTLEVPVGSPQESQIIEEMADVQVCLWHLAYLLNADYSEICERKLDKEIERIKERGDD